MRPLLALLTLLLLAAAMPASDWRQAVARTPAGAHVIGNPAARIKLVEYGSYTCPHCAAFATESAPVLRDRLIRGGGVSLEYRHLVRDAVDLAAAVLARCGGPQRFAVTSEAIYAEQPRWLPRAIAFQQASGQRIAMYPRLAQLRAFADGAGLTALAQARGLSAAATDACFADAAEVDRILQLSAAAPASVRSTPSFLLNGRPVADGSWPGVQAALRAAGAR